MGKPNSKAIKDDPNLKEKFKDVTTCRRLHVLVSYEGEDAKGNKVTVTNVPATLSLKGSNFAPFNEEYIKKIPRGKRLWDFEAILGTEKKKEGTVTFYIIHFEVSDWKNVLPMTTDVFETIKALKDRVSYVNKEIDEKYFSAVHNRSTDASALEAINTVKTNSSLEEDMDEDELIV